MRTILGFIFLLVCVSGSLLYKEDKVCDPMGTNIFPYTGFRLTRQYTFSPPALSFTNPLKGMVRHYIRLTHCVRGRANYEAYLPTERNTGFIWGINMCGSKYPSKRRLKSSYKKFIKDEKKRARLTFKSMAQTMGWLVKGAEDVNNITESEFISAMKNRYPQVDLHEPTEWCYRAVRRKKYATREVSLYLPTTRVGGLFMCPKEGVCSQSNAIPVAPLYADDFAGSWGTLETSKKTNPQSNSPLTQRFLNGVKRKYVQRVPYFYTKTGVSSDVHTAGEWPKWARGLDVNERYTYSPEEVDGLMKVTSYVSNLILQLLSINSKNLPWERLHLDLIPKLREGEAVPVNVDQSLYDDRENSKPLVRLIQQNFFDVAHNRWKIGRKQLRKLVSLLQKPFDMLEFE